LTTRTPERRYPFATCPRTGLDLDPAYAALRASESVVRVRLPYGEPAWLVTRYADARLVLGDPRFSRAASRGRDEPRLQAQSFAAGILGTDPPEHTRLRSVIAAAFTRRRVEELRARTAEIVGGLLDDVVLRAAPFDLVSEVAVPLPVTVICELLGVPTTDRQLVQEWSDASLSTSGLTHDEVRQHLARLYRYLATRLAERRRSPTDDLLSALVLAGAEPSTASGRDLLHLAVALLVAGHETTVRQIPNMVFALLTHPDQLAAVRADERLIPAAVEESMRWIPLSTSACFARYPVVDVELGGVLIRAGEPVLVAMASANRDEQVFEEGDRLMVDRTGAPHLGFGHGPHYCPGAALARMELQVLLTQLLRRLPGLRLATPAAEIDWTGDSLARTPRSLLLAWDPAGAPRS
jgi:cytochrome P450